MIRSRTRSRPLFGYFLTLFVLAALGIGAYLFLNDLEGPTITLDPDTDRISPSRDMVVTLEDEDSDIRQVAVRIRKSSGVQTLLEQSFPDAAPRQQVTFNLKEAGLKDGTFELEISAKDTAFAGFGMGNGSTRTWSMRLDARPPHISVRSTSPSIRRGSSTAFAYSVSEDVSSTGVEVGDVFFPAYRQPDGLYYCFVAFPLHMPADRFTPVITARDTAGNETRSPLLVHAQDRNYRTDTITISDKFLNAKAQVFAELVPEELSDLERYIKINNETRLKDEAVLRRLAEQTSPVMLWSGPFKRLPGSAVMAQYGDNRTYLYNGQAIDRQTHMGLDLASTAKAPVPAGNSGRVVFAEPLGIFGNLIVIDHGVGLMSLYSHMSEMLVNVGDEVKKGDIIARTGTTGLAVGDHLHFGMLVGGIQVQPVDWLDKNWIKNTISGRLAAASKK